jgi:hypothetical protein
VDCAKRISARIKGEMLRNILISLVLMAVGVLLFRHPLGALPAGIPYGWAMLTGLTAAPFQRIPWAGTAVWFLVKLLVSFLVGVVALPVKLVGWITQLRRMDTVLKTCDI